MSDEMCTNIDQRPWHITLYFNASPLDHNLVQESYGKIIVNPPLIAIVMKPKGLVSEICV